MLKRTKEFIATMKKEKAEMKSKCNSKCQNDTLNLSLEELAIINILLKEPSVNQKRIAELTGKSERTTMRRTIEMQEKGLICRENGKRNGRWKVLVEL